MNVFGVILEGVLGGLDLHGRNRTMWTPLLATASPGDKVLRLAETSNWKTGDTIIITSTSYDPNETEEREIVAINENTNENTNEVTVNEPLSYTHIGMYLLKPILSDHLFR